MIFAIGTRFKQQRNSDPAETGFLLVFVTKISLDRQMADDYSVKEGKIRMIDSIDTEILAILQKDARISNAEIARQVGLAPSAVLERVRKLEERGIIRGYAADIDPRSLDFGLTAFVAVRITDCSGPAGELLAEIPEVLEVHDVAGEDSYWVKVRTKDTEALSRLLREKIKAVPTVTDTRTTVVLQTFKESNALPIEARPAKEVKKAKK
jgi:Lrp/AsnC family transcriptional regulator, leucine-responsive regulatory protein